MKLSAFALLLVTSISLDCHGMAGTSVIAAPGRKVSAHDAWAEGVVELVNDQVRTKGWNSFFSEWPNDVNQYAMEAKSMDDVNRLMQKLAAIKSKEKIVFLCQQA